MSILVTLYSNVSHAYTVSDFTTPDSVLTKFPSLYTNSRFPECGGLLDKGTKSFEWLHSLPH